MAKAKFSISPHVVRQLGAELVTDQVTALMELIKNSYDADATYVKITIDTQSVYSETALFYPNHRGYIIVEDDGCGMDEETILKSWLTISYSNKRSTEGRKVANKSGRTPLGDKGLGRLSTQRLANICEILSKTISSKDAIHAGFDWRAFDTANNFSDVDVPMKNMQWDKAHGTKLILADLVDINSWQGKGLDRFKAMLCQLISPFEELRPFMIFVTIDGEKVDIVQEINRLNQTSISDIRFNYHNSIMTIEADISPRKLIGNDIDSYRKLIQHDGGAKFLDYFLSQGSSQNYSRPQKQNLLVSLKTKFSVQDVWNVTVFEPVVPDPGDFNGRIKEFSFLRDDISSLSWNELYNSFDAYKTMVQGQLGIKLFRDGFAIRPYGIDGQDWLELSRSQTSGTSFYGLRPANVIGYVAISESVNFHLKDKTDREGLVDNNYYLCFLELLKFAIDRLNREFNLLRRGYNDYKRLYSQNNKKIKSLEQAFSEIAKQSNYAKDAASDYELVQKQFNTISEKIKDIVAADEITNNDSQYRKVVSSSLSDISNSVIETQSVLEQIHRMLEQSRLMDEVLSIIRPKLDLLEERLNEFSELASLGLISEMVSHDLGQISRRLMSKGNDLEKAIKRGLPVEIHLLYSVVEHIKSTCSSLQAQIKHLDSSLKYSREKKESFSLLKLLKEDELPYYKNKFREIGIMVKLNCPNDFDIFANRGKLIQVFDNLINNSIYWLKRDKIVNPRIEIEIDNPWVHFSDNGRGIDTEVEDTLFEPFISCKPRGEGRGLGLFIIRQILTDYGGDIVLNQKRNSDGRRYCFTLNFSSLIS